MAALTPIPVYMRIGDSSEYVIAEWTPDAKIDTSGSLVTLIAPTRKQIADFLRQAADAIESDPGIGGAA